MLDSNVHSFSILFIYEIKIHYKALVGLDLTM